MAFPDFDFKIDCGDDPKVRQWLHDNGCDFPLGGIQERHMDDMWLVIKSGFVYLSSERSPLPQINPYDYMQSEPTIAERMAELIEKHKDKIPDWARWVAADGDGDGECCVFSQMPRMLSDCFANTAPPFGLCDLLLRLPKEDPLTINWRETLTELKPATEQEQDHGTIEVDPVKHATSMYNQQKMIDRDERDMSQAELDYEFDQLVAWNRERIKKRDQKLTIPSTLPAEQAMPMMLGGEFGGLE